MRTTPGFRSMIIIFLSTLVTISTLGFCATSAVAQTGCITGLVIDETGRPREHIKVEALKMGASWAHYQGWTEVNGRFQIPGIPPAKYEIVSGEAQGPYPNYANSFFYGTPELYLSVTASATCEDVVIHLGPETAKLNLWVLDAVTKQPIKESVVKLTRPSYSGLDRPSSGREVTVPSMTELQMQLQAVGYESSATIKLPPSSLGKYET